MLIDFKLLPKTDETMWNCENCGSSLDLSWIISDLVEECEGNEKYKERLFSSDKFSHRECDCCNHSVWFYKEQTNELKNFVKTYLNENS